MAGDTEPEFFRTEPILEVLIEKESDLSSALAAWISELKKGDLVILHGEMGAGKTAVVRAIAPLLSVTDPVRSPTFSLIHRYRAPIPVIHADLYRLNGKPLQELLDDLPDSISFVEWGQESLIENTSGDTYLLDISWVENNRLIRVWELQMPSKRSQ